MCLRRVRLAQRLSYATGLSRALLLEAYLVKRKWPLLQVAAYTTSVSRPTQNMMEVLSDRNLVKTQTSVSCTFQQLFYLTHATRVKKFNVSQVVIVKK